MIRSAILGTSALTGALIYPAGALPIGVIRPRSIGLSLTVGL